MGSESLKEAFRKAASKQADRTAISFLREGRPETELTYGELNRDACRLANAFAAMGIRQGERVIFYLDKCLLQVVAHLALQKIGAISVPLNPGFKKAEMAYFLKDAEPALVLADPEGVRTIRDIDPQQPVLATESGVPYRRQDFFRAAPDKEPETAPGADDPGVIIYTSGTTGLPKGAILTQRNLVHDARNVIRTWEIAPTDWLCHALPLFHVHGLCFALHTALLAGARVRMLNRFEPETVIQTLSRREPACTVFMAVPSMYAKLMEHLGERRPGFGHMRLWTSGSAPLLVKDFERIREVFGQEPVEREGMTETGMNFSNPVSGKRKAGSIGKPLPELQVRIVNPDTGEDLPQGRTGEIWLKGPAVTPGYWRKPEETAGAFAEGWFRTGDLGRVDEEGYYYLTDRIKHIIISGGENISPKEVEGVINRLEGVLESSVVGLADEKWGEKVVAAVVKRPGSLLTPEEVRRQCRSSLHDWKCPKEVRFVSELPKNTMGKVLKDDVKRLFGGS